MKSSPLRTRIHRLAQLVVVLATAGCAATPPPPYRVEEVAVALGAACIPPGHSDDQGDAEGAATRAVIPRGIVLVNSTEPGRPTKRSQPRANAVGTATLIVAGERCVFTLDPATAAVAPLKSGAEPFRPTAVSAVAGFVALLDEQQGAIRWLNTQTGETVRTMVGLNQPAGIALVPGGTALVTEYAAGRVLRLRPTEESRPLVVIDGLAGPVAVAGADAMVAYVTERNGGRIVRFNLRDPGREVLAEGLDQPEGMVMLQDGRLAVIEAGLGRITRVDPATGRTDVMATGLRVAHAAGSAPAVETAPGVMALAVAGDGSLYVADPAAAKIFRIVPHGPK